MFSGSPGLGGREKLGTPKSSPCDLSLPSAVASGFSSACPSSPAALSPAWGHTSAKFCPGRKVQPGPVCSAQQIPSGPSILLLLPPTLECPRELFPPPGTLAFSHLLSPVSFSFSFVLFMFSFSFFLTFFGFFPI